MKPLVEALCLMKGIDLVAASTILSVTGDLRRFSSPLKLTAYVGLVPSEHSSGDSVRRAGITKAGNLEVRRVLVQAAWCYRFPARVTKDKERRYTEAEKKVRDVAGEPRCGCAPVSAVHCRGKRSFRRLHRCCTGTRNLRLGNGASGPYGQLTPDGRYYILANTAKSRASFG